MDGKNKPIPGVPGCSYMIICESWCVGGASWSRRESAARSASRYFCARSVSSGAPPMSRTPSLRAAPLRGSGLLVRPSPTRP